MDSTQEEFVNFVHVIAAADALWYDKTEKNNDKIDNEPPISYNSDRIGRS